MAEHGTYAQLQQHRRAGEEPCDACRQAGSDYTREWRQRPGKADRNRLYNRARGRAQQDLAERHPDEYQALLQHHLDTPDAAR